MPTCASVPRHLPDCNALIAQALQQL